MELDHDMIEKVARLSRLRLSPEEEKQLLADFQEILAAFSLLDEAEVECDPAFHAIEIENLMREDMPSIEISPDEMLEQMKTLQRYIRGPRMQ